MRGLDGGFLSGGWTGGFVGGCWTLGSVEGCARMVFFRTLYSSTRRQVFCSCGNAGFLILVRTQGFQLKTWSPENLVQLRQKPGA